MSRQPPRNWGRSRRTPVKNQPQSGEPAVKIYGRGRSDGKLSCPSREHRAFSELRARWQPRQGSSQTGQPLPSPEDLRIEPLDLPGRGPLPLQRPPEQRPGSAAPASAPAGQGPVSPIGFRLKKPGNIRRAVGIDNQAAAIAPSSRSQAAMNATARQPLAANQTGYPLHAHPCRPVVATSEGPSSGAAACRLL